HDLLQVAGRGPHDLLTDLGRPGEGDLLDVRMRGDRRARSVAVAGQQIDDAVRDTCLGDELVEEKCRKWRLFSGFDQHAAARGEGRGEVWGKNEKREVVER